MPPDVLAQHAAGATTGPTWADLLARWELVEADLHETYGIDFDALPGPRTWRWLRVRIVGLVASPDTRIARALHAQTKGAPR